MRSGRSQANGFTLIEIILVLAISSLLVVALINSYNSSQRRTRFNDAIERIVSQLETIRTEVNSAYTAGTGMSQSRIFFAKAVSFSNNQASYTVDTLTALRTPDDSLSTINQEVSRQITIPIPWGVFCACPGASSVIVFVRHPASSQTNVYVMNNLSTIPNTYPIGSGEDMAVTDLTFQSIDNLQAVIRIDAATGEITRRYIN